MGGLKAASRWRSLPGWLPFSRLDHLPKVLSFWGFMDTQTMKGPGLFGQLQPPYPTALAEVGDHGFHAELAAFPLNDF